MAKYDRQFYPGKSVPAANRRRYMDPQVKLKKRRSVSADARIYLVKYHSVYAVCFCKHIFKRKHDA